jgi:TetR/AcrR family transcriptional repressor of nem operon
MLDAQPVKRRRGRPPKHLQGFSETRQLLLQAGVEILTEKGFSAAGLEGILKRVKVPKGSFYHYFDSKEAFGLALIHHYDSFFEHKLDGFLKDTELSPLDRIRSFVQDAIQGMSKYDYRRGCLVGNLGQEMGSLPEPYRAALLMVFESWQQKFEVCLEEARQAGEISQQADSKHLAFIFWIGWEGAVLRAKLEQSPQPLQSFADYFFDSLSC